jgi:transcriptional regulator with XRE-family HTH domain
MARKVRPPAQHTGLYYAREARGMRRSELVRLSGVSKQQLSRLENNQIRLRLDHLKPFAPHLGYSPEQMLLWGRFPGTDAGDTETNDEPRSRSVQKVPFELTPNQIPELDTRVGNESRKDGRKAAPLKNEKWGFPGSFVRDELHSSPDRLLVLEATGDSMAPTINSGERVIIDTGYKKPSPDGLYAIRDTFGAIIVRRLQVLRSSRPTSVNIISDNPKHPSEEAALGDIEIVGKVLGHLKLF